MTESRKFTIIIAILMMIVIFLGAVMVFVITYKSDRYDENVRAAIENDTVDQNSTNINGSAYSSANSSQSQNNVSKKDSSNGIVSKVANQGIGNILTDTVSITIAKEMLDLSGDTFDYTLTKEQKDNGFTSIKKNKDGSATYTIKNSEYKKFIAEMKKTAKQGIDEITADGSFPSIKSISYNDDLSKIVITADRKAFENSFDSMAVFRCGLTSCMYQMYDIDAEGKCTVEVKDSVSGEVFQTTVYPDALNK